MSSAFSSCLSSGCAVGWRVPFSVVLQNLEPRPASDHSLFKVFLSFFDCFSSLSLTIFAPFYLGISLQPATAESLFVISRIFGRSPYSFFRCKVRLHRCIPSTSRFSFFLLKITAAFRIFLLDGSPITKCGSIGIPILLLENSNILMFFIGNCKIS